MDNSIYASSWCGKLFCSSLFLILAIILANNYIPLLPFGGLYIFLYVLSVSLLTIWISCVVIQRFLKRTKPVEFKEEHLKWLYEAALSSRTNLKPTEEKPLKDLEERISDFSNDIEEQYVAKWFKHITNDDTFCEETRIMIADATRRFLQIVVLVDGKKLLHGLLLILLKHLKEFRRSQKRCEKNGGSVEQLYRYSHVGSKSAKSQEFFLHKLTESFLRQFINWELWNSLPCRTLVAVLSRKLVNYLLVYISKPGFLNYRLLSFVATDEIRCELNLEGHSFVSLNTAGRKPVINRHLVKVAEGKVDGGNTPRDSPQKTVQKRSPDLIEFPKRKAADEVKSSMVVSRPVKIYESKSTSKIWRDSSDLECVSLGQDTLASFSEDVLDKKLWGEQKEAETTAPALTNFLKPSTTSAATLITNTIKPIENVTASIFQQSTVDTVNNIVKPVSQVTTTAMHKIGDFQDEAAGVMEGIFDFGMAGIRKGLRLTGLQDNLGETAQKAKQLEVQKGKKPAKEGKKLPKWPQIVMDDTKPENTADDNVWINPLTSPNFEGDILLEKSPTEPKHNIPQISTDSEHVDSPEPEYEEAADFATTIAKLRSLLQQKSSESNMTTPAVSPMPQDESSAKSTPPSATCEASDVTDGVMPSLYKFCAKTATGMFQNTINTLKTALPGNSNEQQVADNWTYVASDVTSKDTISRVKRLLAERREFCTVDTAYEAIDSLNIEDNTEDTWTDAPPPFDDDLDDFEQQVPLTKALLDVFCELIADTNTSLVQESVVRSILLLIGQETEQFLELEADKLVKNVNRFVGKLPVNRNQETLPMQFEKALEICINCCPGVVKQLLSEAAVSKSFALILSAFQSQKINEDVFLQVFELVAQQVILANSQLTPAFSA